jgi:hypothetical protein
MTGQIFWLGVDLSRRVIFLSSLSLLLFMLQEDCVEMFMMDRE